MDDGVCGGDDDADAMGFANEVVDQFSSGIGGVGGYDSHRICLHCSNERSGYHYPPIFIVLSGEKRSSRPLIHILPFRDDLNYFFLFLNTKALFVWLTI